MPSPLYPSCDWLIFEALIKLILGMNAWATKRQIASVFYENLAKTKKGN